MSNDDLDALYQRRANLESQKAELESELNSASLTESEKAAKQLEVSEVTEEISSCNQEIMRLNPEINAARREMDLGYLQDGNSQNVQVSQQQTLEEAMTTFSNQGIEGGETVDTSKLGSLSPTPDLPNEAAPKEQNYMMRARDTEGRDINSTLDMIEGQQPVSDYPPLNEGSAQSTDSGANSDQGYMDYMRQYLQAKEVDNGMDDATTGNDTPGVEAER